MTFTRLSRGSSKAEIAELSCWKTWPSAGKQPVRPGDGAHRVRRPAIQAISCALLLVSTVPAAFPVNTAEHDRLLAEARGLRESGALRESAVAFQRFLDAQPEAWAVRYELSQILLTLRELDGAEAQLQRAILTVPGQAALWARLGQVYLLKGDPELAERSLVRARALRPEQVDVRYNLGLLYETMGDLEKAFTEYKGVLDLGGPEDLVRQSAKKSAQYHLIVDQPEEALRCFRRSAELFPGQSWPHEQLAELLYRMSRHDEALAEYKAVIELAPENSAAHFNVGFMSKMRGDLEQAEREFALALALSPGSPRTLYELGAVLFEKGAYEDAAKRLSEAVVADPAHFRAHYYYARTLLKLGRREEAMREMELYKEIKRKSDEATPRTTMGIEAEEP